MKDAQGINRIYCDFFKHFTVFVKQNNKYFNLINHLNKNVVKCLLKSRNIYLKNSNK